MNTKDRKDYRRNQRALIKHLGRARNAIAEMDAITHGTKPSMLHSSIRNMRELVGLAYGMTLDTRLELWLDFGVVKPSDHPAGRGTGGLAAQPTTGPTEVGGPKKKKK